MFQKGKIEVDMRVSDLFFAIVFILLFSTDIPLKSENNDFKNSIIEITESDFSKFGLERKNDNLTIIFQEKDDEEKNLKAVKAVISDCKIETRNLKKGDIVKSSTLMPNLIVVLSNNNSAVYYNDLNDFIEELDDENSILKTSEKLAESKIDDWIAFHYRMKNSNDKFFDIYLWYDKSQLANIEFNDSILNQIEGFQTRENNQNFSSGSANESKSKLQIYPNPIYDGLINISFELRSDLIIKFEIYDIHGNIIKEFGKVDQILNNKNSIQHEIDDLISGMYYLVLTTESNQRISSKFINIKR